MATRLSILLFLLNLFIVTPVRASDWPQLQHDPQRTGHSEDTVSQTPSRVWAKGFATSFLPARERLYPQVQPVIANGQLFIGTEMGTLYAFNAINGSTMWTYKTGGPIIATAGVANGKVFFGCLDGTVYALNTSNGSLAWKYDSKTSGLRGGFSSAVLLAENKVFIAHRSGVYFAFGESGNKLWEVNIGVPIFMSSAYNNGIIYFGGQDMKVYAIRSSNGTVVWSSTPVIGSAFKEFWPVVNKNHVFIRPLGGAAGNSWNETIASENDTSTWTLFAFPENSNGNNVAPVYFPHSGGVTMNGAICPPSVDHEGQMLISWNTGWRRLNTDTMTTSAWSRTGGNADENVCSSTAGNRAIIMHIEESNAQFTGMWDLSSNITNTISAIAEDRFCGGSGCFWNNTQGGGAIPAAVADGYIYHNTQNTLNARK